MTAGIVLIRGWFGPEEAFVAFARRFGALERASRSDPNHDGQLFRVIGGPGDQAGVGRYWHADGFAGSSPPPLLTIYHVADGASPASGTAFIDGSTSWRGLTPVLRRRLHGRAWRHLTGSEHPFVAHHPVHGCPILSVNLGKVAAIAGMSSSETRKALAELAEQLDRMPRYVHPWAPGQILIVDNRRMLHRGPDSVDSERILWRASVTRFAAEEE